MGSIALRVVVRLALCAAVIYPVWRIFGVFGLVFCSPLFGMALARPIYEFIEEATRITHWAAMHDVQYQHFVYKGTRLRVIEDDAHFRWVNVDDVHKVVGVLMTERALRAAYPTAYVAMGSPSAGYLSCDALTGYLGRASGPRASHFVHWAQREIAFPAARLREQKFGVASTAATQSVAVEASAGNATGAVAAGVGGAPVQDGAVAS